MKHSIRLRFVAGVVLGEYLMMKLPPAVCLLCFASLVFNCHPVSAQQFKKVTSGIEPVSLGPLIAQLILEMIEMKVIKADIDPMEWVSSRPNQFFGRDVPTPTHLLAYIAADIISRSRNR